MHPREEVGHALVGSKAHYCEFQTTKMTIPATAAQYRKALEKYRNAPGNPADLVAIKRRWRIFLAVEVIVVTAFVALFKFGGKSEFVTITFGILGAWLAFTIQIAFLYPIGKHPLMDLDPGCVSVETRAMTNDVHQRTPLSEDAFYSQFYGGSRITKDAVARILRRLKKIDNLADRLVPTDYLPILWEDLDFADLFYVLNREFGTTFNFDAFDGTLDSLIRSVHTHIENQGEMVCV